MFAEGRRHHDQEPVHILLLEDDPLFADLIRAQLRRTPWVDSRLEVVDRLADAIARLATGEFGLILTDLNLPDSSGLATVEALSRAGEQLIIVLTGNRDPALRAGAVERGAYDFLSKDEVSAAALERLLRLAVMQSRTFHSLRESEARFRGLVLQSSDWYWEQDEECRFTLFEGRSTEKSGNDPRHAIGKRRWEIPSITPVSCTWEEHRAVLEARQPFRDFVYSRVGDDGELRYVAVSGEPVYRADRTFSGYRGLATDVTPRKRAEEELRRFRLAMEHSADIIVLIDRATMRHVDVNNAACRLLGYSREELLTMGPADILPVDREALAKTYDQLIADPSQASGMKSYYRCKDGSRLPFESTRRAIRTGDTWLIAAISRDIRDRLAAEAALRESQALKGAVLDASVDAIITMDHLGRVVEFNAAASRTFGYPRDEVVGRELAELIIPPEQRQAHRAGLERYLSSGLAEVLGKRIEVQALRADGSRFDVELTVARIADLEPPLFAGMARDITISKRAARLLRLEHSVTRCLAEAEDADDALAGSIHTLCEAEGWQSGRYFELDEAAEVMRFRAAWSAGDEAMLRFNEASRGIVVKRGVGLVGRVWTAGEALWVPDVEADPRVADSDLTRAGGVHGMAAFPVKFAGRTIGVLSLSSREMREPDGRLLDTMRVIGSQLGQFLKRKDTESGLRKSEERFRGLTGLSSDMYWEQDAEYRFTAFRGNAAHALEARRSLLIGKKRWDQTYLNMTPADWAAHQATLDARKSFRDLELCRLDEAGGQVWLSVSGEPVFDESGAFTGYRGVGTDITARKRGERLLALEHAVTRRLADAASDAEALRGAMQAICESEGWESGRYFRLDEEAGRMRFGEAWSSQSDAMRQFNEASRSVTFRPGAGLVGEVWATGRTLWVPDVGQDPRVHNRALARAAGVQAALVFPLTFEGRTIGVLSLSSRKLRPPDERLLQALRVIGSQIGQFLKRKETEGVLRQSEQRFRSLTSLSSDWYWEQDAQLRFTRFEGGTSSVASTALGKRRWELPRLTPLSGTWEEHRKTLDARQPFRDFEYCIVEDSGELRYVSASGEPVSAADGSFAGYRGVARDITKGKRAAGLLVLEHSVTRCLADAENASDALREAMRAICEAEGWESGRYFHLDEQAAVMRFRESWAAAGSEAMAQFNEGSREVTFARGVGLVGHAWMSGEPLWVADITRDARVLTAALAEAAGVHGAVVFPVAFGGRTIGALSITSRRVREPDAQLLQTMRVICSQIGQFLKRKETESVLRESEERFRSLSALSSDWFWETDAEHRFVGTPPRVTEITGFRAPTYVGKARWEVPGLSPVGGDWSAHRQALERRESFRDLELVQARADGTLAYLHVSGEPVYAADGSFKGYRGTAKDVSGRKSEEEQLRRFRAAMDMSVDAIYLVERASMRFVDVNEAACRGVGYSREQLLKMGPHDLLAQSRTELERAYDEVIARGGEGTTSENFYAGASGRKRWTELHRRALRAADGWIIVSISRDITERKLAEQRQAAHIRHQERIARFGQSALGKREPGELIDESVQSLLEALGAEAVAYVEPAAAESELVLRAVVGVMDDTARHAAVRSRPDAPILQVLRSGTRMLAGDPGLPYGWAQALPGAAVVPVRGEREPRGALCVFPKRAEAFGAEELNFIEAVASVLSTALQRIDSEGRLAYLAQFDPLTGLPNRALLADRFSQMIVQARRRDSPLGVLFIDLDEFKMVNDTLGHAGGDELLKEVSVRLQASVRSGDTVARISGDEFAVVLADLARPEDASLVAQKIIDRVAQAVEIHGQEVFVTGSIGIALFPGDGADAETLIGAADAAMYRAKQSGRNAYQFFTAEINQRSRARAQLGSELRRAVEHEEFFLVYQPKLSLAERRPSGAEALLRWKHPERGTVSPVEFIPVLEETGLIVAVGEWVLRRACEDLKAWQSAGLSPGPVSVNLSARQFRLPDLDVRLKAIVAAAGVAPSMIELEITESQLVQDPDHAIRMMRSLRDAGMRIAIDDFGTGYSSLSYLTRFPVGALKIDRSFVRDLIEDASDATIVRTIIEMAHTLGFTVVAEGIETEAQAEYLRAHRCEEGQGFLFAKPMPAAELAAFLAPAEARPRRGGTSSPRGTTTRTRAG